MTKALSFVELHLQGNPYSDDDLYANDRLGNSLCWNRQPQRLMPIPVSDERIRLSLGNGFIVLAFLEQIYMYNLG